MIVHGVVDLAEDAVGGIYVGITNGHIRSLASITRIQGQQGQALLAQCRNAVGCQVSFCVRNTDTGISHRRGSGDVHYEGVSHRIALPLVANEIEELVFDNRPTACSPELLEVQRSLGLWRRVEIVASVEAVAAAKRVSRAMNLVSPGF